MAAPRQMTAQTLNALKGWPQMNAVDFEAKLDATVAVRVPAGSVVHVSQTKTFKLGLGTTNRMPLFTFNASDDPDVVNDGGDAATEKGVWVAINPTGVMMALVAVGAYELVSTNFKAGTYNPNDTLTSPDVTSGGDVAGRIQSGTLGTHVVCGVVSRGVVDNGYGHDAIAFWPVFLPVYP